jgi:serine/threonine protein kinase
VSDATVIDDYELKNDGCIATGSATQIWEVRQKSSGQVFAMKLLLPEAFANSEHKKALKNEATIGKSFDHPNLITIYDLVVGKQHGYFIMEFFRSVSLKQMIRTERAGVQSRVRKIIECISQALAHMHEKNWIHKDIKPDNILVTKGSEVRVIDFSLSSRPSGALIKLMGGSKGMVIQGTRTYLAPELIRRKPLTFAADMYSLGITFYEILTGRPPFIYGNPNDLLMAHVRDIPEKPSGYNPNVAPEADALVMRMLAKKPEDRPKSMMDLYAEIRTVKLFKQDPEEHAREKAEKAEQDHKQSVDSRLDSRMDAGRDKSAPPPPKPVKKKPAPTATLKEPTPAPPPQMQAPQFPQGYPPPGYAQPMAYYPGASMPGQPAMPPGWPAGYPQQQFPPGYAPPQGYAPPAGYPASALTPPLPPSAAVIAAAAASAPVVTQGAAPPPPAPPPPLPVDSEYVNEDELPMMTELPDVM